MRVVVFDNDAATYAQALQRDGAQVIPVQTLPAALDAVPEADALVALAGRITPELIGAGRNLRWVHSLSSDAGAIGAYPGLTVTTCRGIHAPQMSELAVMLMLASLRQFHRMQVNQRMGVWDRWPQPLLQGRTACIIGVGVIAEHLSSHLRSFGMTVTGVTRRETVAGFDRLYPRAKVHAAAAEADLVILLTPSGAANRHIIDETVLRVMKPTSHLIHLSRGGCLDEAALTTALQEGWIAGAALDVFDAEPLPASSPLWSLPNLIITPHLGGYSDSYPQQALPVLSANLDRYLAGGVAALEGLP